MSTTPAALVTGANKGIGYEVVRELSPQFKGTVYLTARNPALGQAAEARLHQEGCKNVRFLQMDVTDKSSIERARDLIAKKHGGLDILVNNAAVVIGAAAFTEGGPGSADQSVGAVEQTIMTNFTGLLDTCETFFPILRAHARVVNVSATLGSLLFFHHKDVKEQIQSETLTLTGLKKVFKDYIKSAKKGTTIKEGYPDAFGPYAMTKIGVNYLTRLQQQDFDKDSARPDMIVNAVCPGYVATDINNHTGPKTVEQGADSILYAALLPHSDSEPLKPRGEFIYERRVYDWLHEKIPSIEILDEFMPELVKAPSF